MLRISNYMMTQRALTAMLGQQAGLNDTQLQLSTGRRVLTPSDDPVSSARVLGLNGAIDTVRQYQDNANRARARLETEEGVLLGATNLLQRVNELTIQGNNDTLTPTDSRAIAAEVSQILDQMLSLANTRDSNGEYIFAGYQSSTRPFTNPAVGSYAYQGDTGQRHLQISSARQVADGDTGYDVFVNVATGPVATTNAVAVTSFTAVTAGDITIDGGNGNGAVPLGALQPAADAAERALQLRNAINAVSDRTDVRAVIDSSGGVTLTGVGGSGIDIALGGSATLATTGLTAGVTPSTAPNRNIFDTLYQLTDALERNQPLDRFISDAQLALENMVSTRAAVGGRLNSIDEQMELNADIELSLESHRSDEQDLDYTEAITRFQSQQIALQAAQKAYTQVQGLSLFDYI